MTGVHVGELALRRLRAGELTSPDSSAVKAHLGGCPECGAKLEGLVTEQQRFEQEVPFERFAAGVERAARSPRAAPVAPRAPWLYPAMGMAAALLFALVAQPVIQATTHNRTKGGADIVLRIAGAEDGPQRIAAPGTPEILGPGERVRIGYRPGAHRFVAAVSIDERGEVTPLYPEHGRSLPADEGETTYYLPGSLEFTGKGAERVEVILSDEPLDVDALLRAAREAYTEGRGDVANLPALRVPGEHFHRVFLKP